MLPTTLFLILIDNLHYLISFQLDIYALGTTIYMLMLGDMFIKIKLTADIKKKKFHNMLLTGAAKMRISR